MICEEPTPRYPQGRTGTSAGYQAHRKVGEEICEACREAHISKCASRWSSLTEEQREAVRNANREAHVKYRSESEHLAKATHRRYREVNRAIIRAAKARPCMDCGVEYPYYVMQFDHLNDKEFNVGHTGPTGGRMRLLQEIEKCDVVCANCHAERTHQRRKAAIEEESA